MIFMLEMKRCWFLDIIAVFFKESVFFRSLIVLFLIQTIQLFFRFLFFLAWNIVFSFKFMSLNGLVTDAMDRFWCDFHHLIFFFILTQSCHLNLWSLSWIVVFFQIWNNLSVLISINRRLINDLWLFHF